MRIKTNVTAMNTHRFYTINKNTVAKNAEKLSSGYRVNRAGDDAAGLAISEKMRAEIRGLSMASKNSQDAVSLVQTAEGALQEVQSMLQRMKELAVQSASDSNEDAVDRAALQQEFAQLQDEIDQVADTTTFNDMKLFTDDLGGTDGPDGVDGPDGADGTDGVDAPTIPENYTAKQALTISAGTSLSIPAMALNGGDDLVTQEAINQVKATKLMIGDLEVDLSALDLTVGMRVWDLNVAVNDAAEEAIAAHNEQGAASNADYNMYIKDGTGSIPAEA